jgi:hypothetical protein
MVDLFGVCASLCETALLLQASRPSAECGALSKIEVLLFSVVKVQGGVAPTPGEWKGAQPLR